MSTFQPLDLDFAQKGRPYPPIGLALLLVTCLLAMYVGWIAVQAYRLRQSEQQQFEASQERLAQARRRTDRASINPAEQKKLRHGLLIVEKLRTPWPALLELLEAVPMDNVALLAIEPGSSPGHILIGGEAKDFDAMLRYLNAMQSQVGLSNVSLLSHQIVRQSPGNPLHFQLQARWQQSLMGNLTQPQPLRQPGGKGTE